MKSIKHISSVLAASLMLVASNGYAQEPSKGSTSKPTSSSPALRAATQEPKFSNPVGKMTGMFLFLQSYAPKMFEGSILNSVRTAV